MNRPLRILFLCNEYPPDRSGGIGIFVQALATGLAARGHVVFVLGLSPHPRDQKEDGVRVIMMKEPRAGNIYMTFLARQWTLSRHARTLVRDERIDLVEAADYKGNAAFINFPSRTPAPVIVRYHGTASVFARTRGKTSSRLVRFVEHRGLLTATHRVAVSRFIADAAREEFKDVPAVDEVIFNFIDAAQYRLQEHLPRDPNQILFVGKISLNKGMKELFAALPLLFRRFPSLRVKLAGGDSLEGEGGTSLKEELMRDLSDLYHERVHFLGQVPHEKLGTLYHSAAVCVFPSRVEAMALVALEAMACSCPVVVNGGSSLREVIADGLTGLHADARSPEDLAEKIARLLENHTFADHLGRAARQAVLANFDRSAAIARNETFYLSCIARGDDRLFR